jgi:hypothetical protein
MSSIKKDIFYFIREQGNESGIEQRELEFGVEVRFSFSGEYDNSLEGVFCSREGNDTYDEGVSDSLAA